MKVLEQFSIPKSPALPSEDAVVVTPWHASVIDGATSKLTAPVYGHESPGSLSVRLLTEALKTLPSQATAVEAAQHLTQAVTRYYNKTNMEAEVLRDPTLKITASVIIFSLYRHEIWFYGDCQCRMENQNYTNFKLVDQITTLIRTDILKFYVTKKHSINELRQNDLGRTFIMDLLREEQAFQNADLDNPFSFPVIDGTSLHPEQIRILKCPLHGEIILASDGYPQLFNTLQDTEDNLQNLNQKDPLCYTFNPQTKGVVAGNNSYDDRTYLSFSY